jgi:prevent-host-death family protein
MKTANIIGTYDAKTRFSELIERVAAGEEFTITRHGSPVARLTPVEKPSTPEDRCAAIEQMLELRERLSLGGLRIRDLINEGRP